MEHNEPLNLSIKKRPIAVVPPSSSKTTLYEDYLDSPIVSPMIPDAETLTENLFSKTIVTTSLQWSELLTPCTTPWPRSTITEDNNSYTSSSQPPPSELYQHVDNLPTPTVIEPPASSKTPPTLADYLGQQQSLDIAKMHLQLYLKRTEDYLYSSEQATMTPNATINHLIRTNILTNKIAANNLISIIDKLLEQNVMSEYYYKHATSLPATVAETQTSAIKVEHQSSRPARPYSSFLLDSANDSSPSTPPIGTQLLPTQFNLSQRLFTY